MNIIFMGTPDFAVPALEEIHKKYTVKAVVTQPDKPKGRGRKLAPPPIKEKAIELNIPVLQPEKMKDPDFIQQIKDLKPDIICVIAFRILPAEVYEVASIASFNIHGSLLPKYRGAAPINWAIINGDTRTGLTSFVLQKEVDTGEILLKREVDINDDETFGDMYYRLQKLAPELSIETIELLASKKYKTEKQDASLACPAPKIFKKDCEIDWSKSTVDVRNFIRGMSPMPCAWTKFNGDILKIFRAELSDKKLPANHYQIDDNSFTIACADKSISLTEIQLPGKKAVKIADFLRGYRGEKEGVVG